MFPVVAVAAPRSAVIKKIETCSHFVIGDIQRAETIPQTPRTITVELFQFNIAPIRLLSERVRKVNTLKISAATATAPIAKPTSFCNPSGAAINLNEGNLTFNYCS
jgi:hypothetical protein